MVVYLDDFLLLPASAPFGHPHILDLESIYEHLMQNEPTIPDIVVTILFKYDSAALRGFLDLERSEVHFLRREWGRLDFCISRKGKRVKVSYIAP